MGGALIKALSKPEVALAIGVVVALGTAQRKVDQSSWILNALRAGGPVLLITAMGGALGGVLKLIDVAGWLDGMVLPELLC